MNTTNTLVETERTPDTNNDRDVTQLGVQALTVILRGRGKGVSGPEAKNTPKILNEQDVINMLDDETAAWECSSEVVHNVTSVLNKLVSREKIDQTTISPRMVEELSEKISMVSRAAGYPTVKNGVDGLSRIILNMPTMAAEYYFSPDFIDELQDLAGDNLELSQVVERYFSTKELLRRANSSREPDEVVRRAVSTSAKILDNKTGYLEGVCGVIANPDFVASITPRLVLAVATLSPNSADEVLAKSAQEFDYLAERYPQFVRAAPDHVTELLLKKSKNGSIEKIESIIADKEVHIGQAHDKGDLTRSLVHVLKRTKKDTLYEQVVGRANMYSQFGVSREDGRANSVAGRRIQDARKRGGLREEHFVTMRHGKEYRDVLLDIDEHTSRENETLVRDVLDLAVSIHTKVRLFRDQLPHGSEIDARYAEGFEAAVTKRVTEMLSIMPKLLQGKYVSASIYHGNVPYKDVLVDSPELVRDALAVVDFALGKLSEDDLEYGESTIPVEDKVGRFVRFDNAVAVVIRPQESAQGEQRISWDTMMSPEEQLQRLGTIYQNKPTKISFRLDLERKEKVLSLDMGGSLERVEQTQPLNYLLASIATAGAQEYALRTQGDMGQNDYHVREVFARNLADPDEYRRWLNSVMYGLRGVN